MKNIAKVFALNSYLEKELVETKTFKSKLSCEDYLFNTYYNLELYDWTIADEVIVNKKGNLESIKVHTYTYLK